MLLASLLFLTVVISSVSNARSSIHPMELRVEEDDVLTCGFVEVHHCIIGIAQTVLQDVFGEEPGTWAVITA